MQVFWDESVILCFEIGCPVPGRYGYFGTSQSYHVLKLGVLYLVGTGIWDESAMTCFGIGCSVPGRYGYFGTSQSYHVLKLGVLYLVGTGILGRVSYDVF